MKNMPINNPTNNQEKEPITFFPFLVLLTGINTLLNTTLFIIGVFTIYFLAINHIIGSDWGYILYSFFFLPILIIATMAISILIAFLIKNKHNDYQRPDFLTGVGANILIMLVGLFFIAML